MKLHRVLGFFLAIQLLMVLSAFGQGNYKSESIGAAPSDVPSSLSSSLNSQGVKVTNDQGATLCEIWLRKSLPANPNPSTSSDVLFGALAVGTFVGVVHLPAATPDFRSQTIKPGYYTLRYVLIPQDGNHMGVNPYRDAFVLGPVAADADPNKTLAFDGLVKLGLQASGTHHPALLVGAPVSGTSFPSVAKDDSGHWNVQMKAQQPSGELPLAITVVGKWEG
jgi:hypothetical protein